MRILLDTCTFLWIAIDAPELSSRARSAFADPENEVFLSAVSGWEIAIKHELGRLALPGPPDVYVPELRRRHGIAEFPLGEETALYLHRLPPLHRDPFDRLLVCQSIVEGMALLTPDEAITRYPIRSIW